MAVHLHSVSETPDSVLYIAQKELGLMRPMWGRAGTQQQEDQNVKVILGCSTGARPA